MELKQLQVTAMGIRRRQTVSLSCPQVQPFVVVFLGTGGKSVGTQRGV